MSKQLLICTYIYTSVWVHIFNQILLYQTQSSMFSLFVSIETVQIFGFYFIYYAEIFYTNFWIMDLQNTNLTCWLNNIICTLKCTSIDFIRKQFSFFIYKQATAVSVIFSMYLLILLRVGVILLSIQSNSVIDDLQMGREKNSAETVNC